MPAAEMNTQTPAFRISPLNPTTPKCSDISTITTGGRCTDNPPGTGDCKRFIARIQKRHRAGLLGTPATHAGTGEDTGLDIGQRTEEIPLVIDIRHIALYSLFTRMNRRESGA